MAMTNFQSVKYSSLVENTAQEMSVIQQIANLAYQAESVGAKQVEINFISDVTIRDYTEDTNITTESLSDSQITLELSQKKYFSFTLDRVQLAQSQGNYGPAALKKASNQLAIAADDYAFGSNTYAAVPADNKLGAIASSIAINSANVEDYIYKVAEILRDNHVPRGLGFLVVPPWFVSDMNLAGIGKGSDSLATQMMTFGQVRQFAGLNIVESTQLTKAGGGTDEYQILGFSPRCIAFASQINDFEQLPNPNRFGQIVRGLFVFGAEVVFPAELVVLSATSAAEA